MHWHTFLVRWLICLSSPFSTLRMVQSILHVGLHWYIFFNEISENFSCSSEVLLSCFFLTSLFILFPTLHRTCNYLFFQVFRWFPNLIVLSLPLFLFFPFSLSAWYISYCKLSSNRNEIVNHIESECYKLAQKKYKRRHDWVGKIIYWE